MSIRREKAEQAAKHNAINIEMDMQMKQLKAAQIQAYKQQLDSQLKVK